MRACEIVTLVSTIACAMEQCYTKEELEILSAALNQLGDSLATIVTVKSSGTSDNSTAASGAAAPQ